MALRKTHRSIYREPAFWGAVGFAVLVVVAIVIAVATSQKGSKKSQSTQTTVQLIQHSQAVDPDQVCQDQYGKGIVAWGDPRKIEPWLCVRPVVEGAPRLAQYCKERASANHGSDRGLENDGNNQLYCNYATQSAGP